MIISLWLVATFLLGALWHDLQQDFEDGREAAVNGDFATAHRIWMWLAEKGDARAQFNLGLLYKNGEGVPQNLDIAVKWYIKSGKYPCSKQSGRSL